MDIALQPPSLTDRILNQILDLIRQNNLAVGDSLPSELELTQKLNVSRTVIREALSRLRMLGILESRKRRGMVVAEPDVFGGCKHVLDAAFLNPETQQDLWEMRLILEMGLAELLFLRKTDADLDSLETIVQRQENVTSEKERLELDVQFHTELYRIAGNHILNRFQALLQPFFAQAVKEEKKRPPARSEVTHRGLLQELRSGTPESFRAAMRKHLHNHFNALTHEPDVP